MTISDLLQWWNLIFVLPFLVALGYALLLSTGMVAAEGLGEADVDEADVDIDLDVEADLDTHFDMHEAESGFVSNALSLLGIGKAPLSIILMCFCFIWGFTGWVSNEMFRSVLQTPLLFIWPSLVVAFFVAAIFTRFIVMGMIKILPLDENYGVSDTQLLGKRATVRFSITPASGTAQVHDQYGTLHEVACRLKGSEESDIKSLPPGTPIVLLDYDRQQKVFLVRADPLEQRLESRNSSLFLEYDKSRNIEERNEHT